MKNNTKTLRNVTLALFGGCLLNGCATIPEKIGTGINYTKENNSGFETYREYFGNTASDKLLTIDRFNRAISIEDPTGKTTIEYLTDKSAVFSPNSITGIATNNHIMPDYLTRLRKHSEKLEHKDGIIAGLQATTSAYATIATLLDLIYGKDSSSSNNNNTGGNTTPPTTPPSVNIGSGAPTKNYDALQKIGNLINTGNTDYTDIDLGNIFKK